MSVQIILAILGIFENISRILPFFQCQEIKNRDWAGGKLGFILEIGHFQL